jgi:regulator of nucleoside diphosphate kinase
MLARPRAVPVKESTMPDTRSRLPMLTELDHVRLEALLRRTRGAVESPLAEVLESADLVASRDIDPDVVTMYTRVVVADDADGSTRTLTPVYPQDAEPEAGFVSALSPIGAALLGRSVGARIAWCGPDGDARSARIVAILFQPEASGDYTL